MQNSLMIESVDDRCLTPEEQLTQCVANALRRFGFPPLQYLNVEDRDGHVYLSARFPTMFLAKRTVDRAPDAPCFETANNAQARFESLSS